MQVSSHGEVWKDVQLPEGIINGTRLEVSNLGRVRTFNKLFQGKIIKGSLTEGYPIVRMKFYRPKIEADELVLQALRDEITVLKAKVKAVASKSETMKAEAEKILNAAKKKLQKTSVALLKKRTVYYHALIHRLVADHFLHRPGEDHKFVAHLDFNKTNNRANNLKFVTQEGHILHREKSPAVIQQMKRRSDNPEDHSASKLSVTKVMLLKKLLNENAPMKSLTKQFKITETQLLRIKRGENWKNIPAYDPKHSETPE